MKTKQNEETKIIWKDNKAITRSELFESKERFHKERAKMPFEEKIKILVRLQKIASSIRNDPEEKRRVWKI
ncbi:MAG: hypothetical protein AB1546_02220 [bacterium]